MIADVNHEDTLLTLLLTGHRLTRMAAVELDDATPAATWRTLSVLEQDGGMRIGDLARATRTSQPGMTRLLPTLVDAGYVHRVADSDDARASFVRITSDGSAALRAWKQRLADALGPAFADLTPREWRSLAQAAEILQSRTATDTKASA
jgi:DNA-binding MarR family transcriptional regulator